MKRFTRTLFPPFVPYTDNSPLALRPLLISGLVTPVDGGDGGVNLQMVSNPAGLITAVDPWLRMEEGDHVQLYWDTTMVGERDVEPADIDQRMLFFLPVAPIQPDWAEQVYYRLTRKSSGDDEGSVAMRIRVKLDPPAGVDKDPHLPGHSELAKPGLPQDVINNGVDAAWAARGVPVEIAAYPGRVAHDTIELRWGDAVLTHRVTASEAAGRDPIVLIADQATILAGGDSPQLLVQYQVYDEVWNFSSDWSLHTFVNVEAGAQRLDAPIIKEAFNGIIDLEQLSTQDVTVQIEIRGLPFEHNDTVTMTWTGKPKVGHPRDYTGQATITNIPSVLEVKVPNAEIRAIIDGTASASYVLTKANGDPPQSSKYAFACVTGKIALPAPTVFEAVGDTLDPLLERAHVVIAAYDAMASGDVIGLIWLGRQQNGTPRLYEPCHTVTAGEAGQAIYMPIPEEYIGVLANGTVDVSYCVFNDNPGPQDIRGSDHLNLVVAARSADLPKPSVVEAVDDVLDPEQVPGHATLLVPYTGTVVGDVLTWYWQGESSDGSATDWIPITSLSAGKPVTFDIPRSLIEPNINNLVKVLYSLKLASTGRYRYSQVLELTIGKLIGPLPPPDVLEAVNGTLNPMQAQSGATARVRYASMDAQDVIKLVWIGVPGAGTPQEQEKPGDASGQVDFAIPATVIGANIGQQVSVVYQVKRYVTEKQSDILLLNITEIPAAQLPSPLISEADPGTGVLNLATFTANATSTVARWPFIALGQRAWLKLEGKTETGGPHTITLLDGQELTSEQVASGLSQSVLRSELEKLGQDTSLSVICKVAFSGIGSEASALPLPVTVYQFKLHHDWVTPVIVSVKDTKGEVPDAGNTFDTTLNLNGTGTIDTEMEIVDQATTVLTKTRTQQDGTWQVDLTPLSVKSYSITARPVDGSGLISQPRTFEVLANLTPTIEQVLDSRGPVSNGGTTVDTTATVSGKASPDQRIELFDAAVPKGIAPTSATGAWSLPVSGLTVGSHLLRAKALYGTNPESTIWTIVVAAAVAPTISSIKDGDGNEIPVDGFTVDTSVSLTGNATANLEVEIFDGNTPVNKSRANANGVWTLPITGLSVNAHAMKAKALYGSGAESTVRRFTVVPSVKPTITAVIDSKNIPIPIDGSTYVTRVTASGNASINQRVEIFDGTIPKGTVTTNASGAWSREISGLAVATHSLTAKGLYAGNPVSNAWGFTVKASMVPTITSIRDSRGEVVNNGSTTDIFVTAAGKATAGQQVQVFDGSTPKGNASVNASGDWSHLVTDLGLGAHGIKAVALYGEQGQSNIRSFIVRSPIPDFVLNPALVVLNGRFYRLDAVEPLAWPSNTTFTRVPNSGVAPYTYTSSNTNIVRVTSDGRIFSASNGSATITVSDSAGRSGSYSVSVSNVSVIVGLGNETYIAATKIAQSRGLRIPSLDECREIYTLYGNRFNGGDRHYWSSTAAPGLWYNYVKNLVTGAETKFSTRYEFMGSWANVIGI